MTVEILAFRSYAHGVDPEAYHLERFLGVKVFPCLIVGHIFFLAELIKVLHRRIIGSLHHRIIGGVGDAETGVQLCKEYFYCVDLRIVKILVATEEVFKEGDVL